MAVTFVTAIIICIMTGFKVSCCLEKPHTGAALENNPETPPSSRDEGRRLLHGLETNLATSLQTPQEP